MPHFIIDCSENIIQQKSPDEIMQAVYEVAESTGLFAGNDIKVRLRPYQFFKLGEDKKDFIHVFGHIMEGRSTAQKADLSKRIIERLNELFPDISILSINIQEFEAATYSNKALIHPLNTTNDRHFEIRSNPMATFHQENDMTSNTAIPFSGNVNDVSKNTRGWFLGHFMPGEANPLRSEDLELKWYTHAKGETRPEWAPGNPVRTLNILLRGHFVLLFPDQEVALEKEGDFVLFGPDMPHSYRSEEESLVLTVRWPSTP